MHDVAKPSIPDRGKKVARRKLRGWIYVVSAALCLIGVVAALKALGVRQYLFCWLSLSLSWPFCSD